MVFTAASGFSLVAASRGAGVGGTHSSGALQASLCGLRLPDAAPAALGASAAARAPGVAVLGSVAAVLGSVVAARRPRSPPRP